MKKTMCIINVILMCFVLMACGSEHVHVHEFNQQLETEEYLKSPGTCTDYEVYYYSCACGAKGTETFEGTSKGEHDYEYKSIGEVGHVEYYECKHCHKTNKLELPKININTNGKTITDDYIATTISVSRCLDEYKLTDILASVKIRGNGSAEYNKKPFRIKFDTKQGMLGLNDGLKAKSWVLINEYNDRSRMRNFATYFISNYLFNHDGYYSTDMRFVEVYINDIYNGIYLLAEQQQVNKGRININEPDKDYTGTDIGYLIELDTYYYEEIELETFAIDYKYPLKYTNGRSCSLRKFQNHYTIKSDVYSMDQNDFIKNVTENIFFILYDTLNITHDTYYYTLDENFNLVKDHTITSQREAVERVLDLGSYIDMFIIQNIAQNVDIGWSSFYLAFDASSKGSKKLIFEAPWDFDWAMGSCYPFKEGMFCIDQDTSGRDTTLADYVNPWMLLFANCDWFLDLVKERWNQLQKTSCFDDLYLAIDILTNEYSSYFAQEFAKYPDSLTKVLDRSKATHEYTDNTTHFTSAMYLINYIIQFEQYFDSIWLDK